ncbi:MAG: serine/threonine-protein kinase [Nannocystaceae bacterium]
MPIPALAFDDPRIGTPRPAAAPAEDELRRLREAEVAAESDDDDGPGKGEAVPAQIGRFSVLQRLGSGGMGVVYAAYDPELDRRVALKVLRAQVSQSSSSSTARARLLREAKALAKLSHPNVVAVYDVGTVDDQVFIAMEFVKGTTLTRWEREGEGGQPEKRSWQEVLALFLQAGRGLAAAHKAGIIHRDFKPDNVLIGRDGRVRVVDFGLARSDNREKERPDTFAEAIKSLNQQSSSVFELRLTRTGGMAGTPAYMAPEQYLNLQVDARTDQFSYCVALYEGLYGQRPFIGDTVARVRKAVINGDIAEAPRDSDVPAWLRKILIRGLSVHPGARYPSMDALLAELSDDPRRPQRSWRRLSVAGVTLLGVAALAYSQLGPRRVGNLLDRPGCREGFAELDASYNSRRKEAIAAAIGQSGNPEAAQTWRRVEGLLGEFVDEWSRTELRVCTVAHFEPTRQSPYIGLHQSCLHRRLGPLKALVSALGEVDARTFLYTVPAGHALLGLRPCSDPSTLRLGVDEPDIESVVAVGTTLRSQLDQAEAMRWLGRGAEALDLVRATTTEAARIEHLPVRAEAYLLQGILEESLGDYEAAERSLKEALWSAEASRHDEVAIDALTLLVRILGVHLHRSGDAEDLHPRLTAAVRRLGDPRREAEAHRNFGLAEAAQGHAEAAVVRLEGAIEFAAGVVGAHGRYYGAELRVDLGRVLREAGRLGESATQLQRSIEALEATAGTNHPVVAGATLELCETLLAQGDLTRAMRSCRRALDLREDPSIPAHERAAARFTLARLHWQAKRTGEAIGLARQARDELSGTGELGRRLQEEISAWIRERNR